MTSLKLFLLLGLLGLTFGKLHRSSVLKFPTPFVINGRAISENLYIDNPYHDAGEWGPVSLCEDGSFANSVEIMYQAPGHLDETAINAIKLYCKNQTSLIDTGYVTSSLGNKGDWYGMQICTNDFITGFRANTLEYQGIFTDDVAIEDFEANCNYGAEILDALPITVPKKPATKDFKPGTWSTWATCSDGLAVCGLQTRYEDGSLGDEAAVVDAVLFCCSRT